MKISIKNLGPIKQAEFELGELTIICGANNTGKTYATYALYGFLKSWRSLAFIKVPDGDIQRLLSDGSIDIDIQNYVDNAQAILKEGFVPFTKRLPDIFASSERLFAESSFSITLASGDIQPKSEFNLISGSVGKDIFSVIKDADSPMVTVSLLIDKENIKVQMDSISAIVEHALEFIIFSSLFPNTFIVSAERTGAAIFRKELNLRNGIFPEETIPQKEMYSNYAVPIASNFEFTRYLETFIRHDSFIAKEHPEILDEFSDIVGGSYVVAEPDLLYFIPKGRNIKLTMGESSSSVRSLLLLAFYLSNVAKKGDLLIVDEPELNLHPENQRRMARLFARLVNIGIKVFITTHSDYIIKELNTLIMLNQGGERLKELAEHEGYKAAELLNADKVKVYVAENATLVSAVIDPEYGVEVTSFDKSIDDMNRIQKEIVWGGDE